MTASYNNADNSEGTAFNSLLQVLISESVSVITVHDLDQIQGEVTILDTREPEEYKVSRIPGSKHVGYDEFDIDKVNHIAKDERIVVYCSVGYRSEKIGERLKNAGYINVKNLYGGIFAWANQLQPVVNDHGSTNKIHPYGLFWSTFISNDKLNTHYGRDE